MALGQHLAGVVFGLARTTFETGTRWSCETLVVGVLIVSQWSRLVLGTPIKINPTSPPITVGRSPHGSSWVL